MVKYVTNNLKSVKKIVRWEKEKKNTIDYFFLKLFINFVETQQGSNMVLKIWPAGRYIWGV